MPSECSKLQLPPIAIRGAEIRKDNESCDGSKRGNNQLDKHPDH